MSDRELLDELNTELAKTGEVESDATASFARGMARGALGPLLDIYYRQSGQERTVKQQDKLSPFAEGLGQVTGLVGGTMAGSIPGSVGKVAQLGTIGGLATKLGKGAASLAGNVTGAKGALARSALRGAGEGGFIGLSEGTTAAVMDRDADMPGIARHVAEGVGYGLAIAPTFNLLGTAFYRTNNALFKKTYQKGIKEAADITKDNQRLQTKYKILRDEVSSIEDDVFAGLQAKGISPPQRGTLSEFIEADANRKLIDDVLSSNPALGGRVGRYHELTGWKPGTSPVRDVGRSSQITTYADTATKESSSPILETYRAIQANDQKLSRLTSKVTSGMGDTAEKMTRDVMVGGTMGALGTMVGGPIGTVAGPGGMAVMRTFFPTWYAAIADVMVGGLEKTPGLRRIIGNSIKLGDLTLDKAVNVGGKQVRVPAGHVMANMVPERAGLTSTSSAIDKYVYYARDAGRSIKLAPVHHLTSDEYNDVIEEFDNVDMDQYEMQVRGQLAAVGSPQEVANGHIDHMTRVRDYIHQSAPQRRGEDFVVNTGEKLVATDQERMEFSYKLRAAMMPATVFQDLIGGTLNKHSAHAFWAVHTEIAQEFADKMKQYISYAMSDGVRLSADKQRQISIFMNELAKPGKLYNHRLISKLQSNYRSDRDKPQQAQPGAGGFTNVNLGGVSSAAMSPMQSLGMRLGGK